MGPEFFVSDSSISVREYRHDFWRRAESRIRRTLLRQNDGERSIVRQLCRFPDRDLASGNGLDHITLRTPGGRRPLYFRPGTTDEEVIRQIFRNGDYRLPNLARWPDLEAHVARQHALGRRPLIIDAGANIGASAVYFALAFPTATIIAIEPEPSNFALLQKNVAGLNVTCMQAALSSTEGYVDILDGGGGEWAFRTTRAEGGGGTPCTTIASIYAGLDERSTFTFLVKIDIEGAEEDVFGGNTAWVEQTPLVVVELHDWMLPGKGSSLPFLRCMGALDRDFVYSGENVFSIDNALAKAVV